MNEVIPGSSKRLRWAHEYMFSLNVTWIIVWLERVRNKSLDGTVLAQFLSRLVGGAYQLVSPIGGFAILEQLLWSFSVALIVFFLLRLLSRFAITNFALLTIIAGAVSIAALPIATLFFGLVRPDCCVGATKFALALELLLVVSCSILFYLRKLFISEPLMILVLALHFISWAWATSSYVNIPALITVLRTSEYYHPWIRTLGCVTLAMAFNFGFPVIGFVASVMWIRYIRRSPDVPHAECAQASV
jgi:hypothetical protein